MIVVDACAWVNALVVGGPRADAAREILSSDPRWVAPAHMPIEVLRTLRKGVAGGQLTTGEADRCVRLVAATSIELVVPGAHVLERVWALRSAVSMYDAPYLAIAEVYGVPLVTADERLARATRSLGIEAIVPA